MRHIARLAIRRPVPILIFWVGAFLVALLFVGKARDNLHETQLEIPGTAAARAAKLSERQFGGSIAMAILLEAPEGRADLIRREGPKAGAPPGAHPRRRRPEPVRRRRRPRACASRPTRRC